MSGGRLWDPGPGRSSAGVPAISTFPSGVSPSGLIKPEGSEVLDRTMLAAVRLACCVTPALSGPRRPLPHPHVCRLMCIMVITSSSHGLCRLSAVCVRSRGFLPSVYRSAVGNVYIETVLNDKVLLLKLRWHKSTCWFDVCVRMRNLKRERACCEGANYVGYFILFYVCY